MIKYYRFFVFLFFIFSCSQKSNKGEGLVVPVDTKTKVFFKNINNGDTLESPFIVEMGVKDMIIKPAGEFVSGTGHHHILIDRPFMRLNEIIPMDENHLHYGKGDSIAELSLTPGPHTLTLQFANGMHGSYGEQFSKTINIYVK